MSALNAFADYAAGLSTSTLPPAILHHARRALIDWYAAALPGALMPPATMLEVALAEELDHGNARLLLGRSATMRAAALINGTAAHAAEFDDIFRDAIFHPGAPAIAAALAAAQGEDANGAALLRAIVAGYEVSTRIGVAMGRGHYRYWHTTGTVGCFGAAAAAGVILMLGREKMLHALATAATFAAGLQQAFRSDSLSKPLHAGRAAEAGLLAALAARAGVTGAADVLEGDAGFGRAMGSDPDWNPDWQAASANLGDVLNIGAVTVKNHACCGHTFAAIDGALELKQRMQLLPEHIARVGVATYGEALKVAGNPEPRTPAEARFSLAYVVAHALLYGSVRLAAFAPERLADPALRKLMRKVDITIDRELDLGFPGKRAARITVETIEGRKQSLHQPTRKGDPDAPLSDAELDAKFHELAAPVIGEAAAQALLRRLWEIDAEPCRGLAVKA
jgi:2-methylcitrate dehydratase PrpD